MPDDAKNPERNIRPQKPSWVLDPSLLTPSPPVQPPWQSPHGPPPPYDDPTYETLPVAWVNTPAVIWLRYPSPSRTAVFVAAWLIVASALAVIAFGLPHVPRGGWLVVSLAHAHDAGRLIAFAGLGMLVLFGLAWLAREICSRHSAEAIGIFLTCAGVAGALVMLGAAVLSIDIAGWVGTILLFGSAALFFGGLHVIRQNPPAPPPQPAAQHRGRDYDRKEVTVHGDARSADDWEIDQALRTKSGGFDPMFKD
ncbi:MAG TPA: hypothetical protein VM755_21445 [Stellaceae bacterium]|nr:hypothetical protein [Stellaceae bacterium]